MKKLWFFLAMFVCVLASCSDGGSDEPSTPTPKPEEVKTEITIDSGIVSNGLSFASSQGEQSVSFSVNANWTLNIASTTSGATWCKASATNGGKGSANVKFTFDENTSYDDRSVSVTIKAGTVSKTFTITQKGADAMLVTTTKYEVAQEGGKIEVEVKANIDYQFTISETAKDWIAEAKSKSRGLTTYKHTFEIAMNEEAEKREGEITFNSGDKVETVKVYQAGGAIILLTQNEYTVSDAGETISVDIKSNVDFGVQMPDVDWITDEASSRGMSSHTLKYVVAPNEGYDRRSAEIIFYDKNSDLNDTLKVVQVQKDAIIVAKNEYTIDAVGGDLKFEINTNVDFEVSTSADWIKQNTESRALEVKPLSFTIAENTADEAREGLITISSGELKQEIKVLQKENTVFSLSETEFNITSEGGEIKVEVSTNGEYTITMPEVDWLKENESRTTSTFSHTFTVAANETYDAREAEISFTHKETGEVAKVKVVQAQKDAIVISQKEYDVKAEGETVEVKVNTNVEFEVEIPSDATWITQTNSRALTEKSVYLKISENTGEESRSATVTITNKESQVSETIVVIQQGNIIVVTLKEAGTMKKLLGNDYLNITSLKVVGPINGDDVYYLRKMLGAHGFSEADWGKLNTLDLSQATIVEGGNWYYDSSNDTWTGKENYTSNNVIGDYMFCGCANLKSLDLPKDIISIGSNAISGCEALPSIAIPRGVTSIGDFAFAGCNSLDKVHISNLSEWCKITFGYMNNPFNNGAKLYIDNELITELTIPEDVTRISDGAFKGCESIISVNIPDHVVSIGSGAFADCKTLSKLVIGKNVNKIGSLAFENCSIIECYSYNTTPPNISVHSDAIVVFKNGVKEEAVLHVPERCGVSYKNEWGTYFKNIIEMD